MACEYAILAVQEAQRQAILLSQQSETEVNVVVGCSDKNCRIQFLAKANDGKFIESGIQVGYFCPENRGAP